MLFAGTEMRTKVHVDGFNLYYGALKGTPFRWLDPVRLSSLLLPRECAIDRLRYFTARVSGEVDPGAPARQRIYMKALATLPETRAEPVRASSMLPAARDGENVAHPDRHALTRRGVRSFCADPLPPQARRPPFPPRWSAARGRAEVSPAGRRTR